MNLKEFDRLSQAEQLELWQKLSQEERDSLMQERRANREGAPSPQELSAEIPSAPVGPARSHEVRLTGPEGITKFQGTIIIFLLLVALGWPLFGILRPVQQWEYRIESPSDTVFSTMMDQYGREGWELVAARRASDGGGTMSYECIFKRPKR